MLLRRDGRICSSEGGDDRIVLRRFKKESYQSLILFRAVKRIFGEVVIFFLIFFTSFAIENHDFLRLTRLALNHVHLLLF